MKLTDYTRIFNMDFYKNEFQKISEKYKNKKIIIYGAGEFFDSLNDFYSLTKHFNIVGISDLKFEKNMLNSYKSIPVIKPSCLKEFNADVILLTLANPFGALNSLRKTDYTYIKEILPFFEKIDPILSYDVSLIKKENNKSFYHLNSYDVNLVSDEYSGIIEEIFFWQIYNIKKKFKFSDYNLYDIGMNRAYTDIYFSLDKNCKKCFGFEPFKETYNYAIENIELNPDIKQKIEAYNFGLSNKNSTEKVYFLPHRDGISSVNYEFLKYYAPEELNHLTKETVELKKADEVISKLMAANPSTHKILKLDAEGAEYEVLPNLFEADILKEFNVIIGDMHVLKSKNETIHMFDYFYKSGFRTYELNVKEKTMDYIFFKDIELI